MDMKQFLISMPNCETETRPMFFFTTGPFAVDREQCPQSKYSNLGCTSLVKSKIGLLREITRILSSAEETKNPKRD